MLRKSVHFSLNLLAEHEKIARVKTFIWVKLIVQTTGGEDEMSRNTNQKVVPEAKAALDSMKLEIAGELGLSNNQWIREI
ncbi:MAG: Small, acid-soluble spore protein alpha/beta type [Anaerosolibacter sp.]|nr:Small, acid-soluble spore protein alpha/beta type [Anaerosolibacter sp.]